MQIQECLEILELVQIQVTLEPQEHLEVLEILLLHLELFFPADWVGLLDKVMQEIQAIMGQVEMQEILEIMVLEVMQEIQEIKAVLEMLGQVEIPELQMAAMEGQVLMEVVEEVVVMELLKHLGDQDLEEEVDLLDHPAVEEVEMQELVK